jgi:hypothetical protein
LNGFRVDIFEMIGAESQTVLNTFTEHDFQDAFKKMAEVLGSGAYVRMGTTSKAIMANRPVDQKAQI